MTELKTQPTNASVSAFIADIEDDVRRSDCRRLSTMMRKITGKRPKMWGASMVGFGSYHYKYASGREGDWFVTGFSPRKQNLTIYIMNGFDRYQELMMQIGKHKTGKSCLYVKKLDDLDENILQQLIAESVNDMQNIYKFK